MSSKPKRAQEAREVRTNSDGRRYVDIADVIDSELRRIERNKDCATLTQADQAQSSNGASGASGASDDKRRR